jgi:hypothetical protein
MEDTLRYFFSATFQGVAAIISLGAMFFIYYLDKIDKKKLEIEKFLVKQFNPSYTDKEISEMGIINYTKQHLHKYEDVEKPEKQTVFKNKLNELEQINANIITHLPNILRLSISILLISLLSLFTIGYNSFIDLSLFIIGIELIILSVFFFN